MGEYLELVPKSAYDTAGADPVPKRILHPEIRDPIYRTALLEAQQESYHRGNGPALPAPELNEIPRLEGPAIEEAA